MKKIISILLTALMLGCAVPAGTASAAPDTDITYTEPYLLTLDPDNEMDICWLTVGNGKGSIEIGETDALGKIVETQQYKINGLRTSAKADGYDDEPSNNPELTVYQQIATVKNLKPDTTYYYRATTTVGGKTETTKTYNFKTAPAKAEVNKEVYSAGLEIFLRNFPFIGDKLFLWCKFTDKIKNNLYLLYPVSA